MVANASCGGFRTHSKWKISAVPPPPSLSIGWQLVLFRGPDPQIPPTISYGVGSVIWPN